LYFCCFPGRSQFFDTAPATKTGSGKDNAESKNCTNSIQIKSSYKGAAAYKKLDLDISAASAQTLQKNGDRKPAQALY